MLVQLCLRQTTMRCRSTSVVEVKLQLFLSSELGRFLFLSNMVLCLHLPNFFLLFVFVFYFSLIISCSFPYFISYLFFFFHFFPFFFISFYNSSFILFYVFPLFICELRRGCVVNILASNSEAFGFISRLGDPLS
jgi:hypothetical protein